MTTTDPPRSFATRLRAVIFGQIVGATIGRLVRLIAALFLTAAGVFLIVAWQSGPERLLAAAAYRSFTDHVDGRIVESWLALDWDPAEMATSLHWRAFAKASPCAVVAYQGDWGAPVERAFCGNRLSFNESYTLHDLREMAPGVPFAWARDPAAFVVPEVRLAGSALQWLSTHPPVAPFPSDPPPQTALAALRLQIDRPIDDALAGWSTSPPAFPLVFDPRHPDGALPTGFVEARRSEHPNWLAMLVLAPLGLWLWVRGMQLLLGNIAWLPGWIITLLPLVFLPWWAEQLPRGLRALDSDVAQVLADMLGDVDPTGRLVASAPAEAVLARGERLVWNVGQGAYAATFGRFRFALPSPPPASTDAALTALTTSVSVQVRALSERERVDLFEKLTHDKTLGLTRAGLVFLPAAKETLLDDDGSSPERRAAREFLSAWVTQPVEEPHPNDFGYRTRVTLFRELADVSVPEIAILAQAIAERAPSDGGTP